MSEVLDRLIDLERRVANLKDWKQAFEEGKKSHEEDKRKWDKEREKQRKGSKALNTLREVLLDLLLPLPRLMAGDAEPPTAQTLNLNHKELVVNLAHEEKELNMTTGTVMGKVLYSALTELSKEGFSEAELSETLKEHGWNVLHNTLAPTLGGLVKDGTLIRIEGAKPARYRLPKNVKLNIGGKL